MSRLPRIRHVLAASAALALTFLCAPQSFADEQVDIELVLAVDVSLSMSPDEMEIQRRGYATALTDPRVLEAITDGAHGRIALTYFEWAGSTSQHVIVPWTVIAVREDAERVAQRISAEPPRQSRRTSISGALHFAADLFAESGFQSFKRVIDISGDGPNNEGRPVDAARDAVVQQKIAINGLPVMAAGTELLPYEVADLDTYYSECVIGGPGSFVMPVNGWEQFPEAIRRKLLIELANTPPSHNEKRPPVILAQGKPPYDCMIGEKLWQGDRGRQRMYDP